MRRKSFYMPIADGRPVAFDGTQLAFCDDLSYWRDRPHRARLYTSLPKLKGHIETSRRYRARRMFASLGRYGWIRVVVPEAST